MKEKYWVSDVPQVQIYLSVRVQRCSICTHRGHKKNKCPGIGAVENAGSNAQHETVCGQSGAQIGENEGYHVQTGGHGAENANTGGHDFIEMGEATCQMGEKASEGNDICGQKNAPKMNKLGIRRPKLIIRRPKTKKTKKW